MNVDQLKALEDMKTIMQVIVDLAINESRTLEFGNGSIYKIERLK